MGFDFSKLNPFRKKKNLEESTRLVISFSMNPADKHAPYCVRRETCLYKNKSFQTPRLLAEHVVKEYPKFEVIKYENMPLQPENIETFLRTFFITYKTKH